MKKPRLLVVGSFVMDFLVRANRFVAPGETILGLDYQMASGGKGANQAVQAALLGADVTMLGKVGNDDFGRQMIGSLKKAGVNVSKVLVADTCGSGVGNVQVQVNEQGTQNRIVVIPGANMTITPEEIACLEEEIKAYDMVLLQLEIPMPINEVVAEYAHAQGVPVMLNPAPSAPLSADLLAQLAYLSPNEHEAADLVGFPVESLADCEWAIQCLCRQGVQRVLITRGAAGVVFGDGREYGHYPSVKCENVADPTAAGESFIGAFCTAVAAGVPAAPALVFANHTAAITVSRIGAQPSLPTLRMVLASLARHGIDGTVFRGLEARGEGAS